MMVCEKITPMFCQALSSKSGKLRIYVYRLGSTHFAYDDAYDNHI